MTELQNDLRPRSEDEADIHDFARDFEFFLSQALRDAPVWTGIDADGTTSTVGPDAEAAAKVANLEARLTAHLIRHRDVLGREPRWQPYYEEIDRNQPSTLNDVPAAAPLDRQTETALRRDFTRYNRIRHYGLLVQNERARAAFAEAASAIADHWEASPHAGEWVFLVDGAERWITRPDDARRMTLELDAAARQGDDVVYMRFQSMQQGFHTSSGFNEPDYRQRVDAVDELAEATRLLTTRPDGSPDVALSVPLAAYYASAVAQAEQLGVDRSDIAVTVAAEYTGYQGPVEQGRSALDRHVQQSASAALADKVRELQAIETKAYLNEAIQRYGALNEGYGAGYRDQNPQLRDLQAQLLSQIEVTLTEAVDVTGTITPDERAHVDEILAEMTDSYALGVSPPPFEPTWSDAEVEQARAQLGAYFAPEEASPQRRPDGDLDRLQALQTGDWRRVQPTRPPTDQLAALGSRIHAAAGPLTPPTLAPNAVGASPAFTTGSAIVSGYTPDLGRAAHNRRR